MNLLATPQSTIQTFRLPLEADPHLFYTLDHGYAMFTSKIEQGSLLTIGALVPISSMFQIYWLSMNGQRVGFYFVSQFHVVNSGGFIAAYMNRGIGKASSVEVLIKTPDMVVYHYTNRGTLVVCPIIGEDVLTIFQEQ